MILAWQHAAGNQAVTRLLGANGGAAFEQAFADPAQPAGRSVRGPVEAAAAATG